MEKAQYEQDIQRKLQDNRSKQQEEREYKIKQKQFKERLYDSLNDRDTLYMSAYNGHNASQLYSQPSVYQ